MITDTYIHTSGGARISGAPGQMSYLSPQGAWYSVGMHRATFFYLAIRFFGSKSKCLVLSPVHRYTPWLRLCHPLDWYQQQQKFLPPVGAPSLWRPGVTAPLPPRTATDTYTYIHTCTYASITLLWRTLTTTMPNNVWLTSGVHYANKR
jgi:hypothetical protein